jgi:hypothetical protein
MKRSIGTMKKYMLRALALTVLLSAGAKAEERMNAMVGLWYGPYNNFSFEYDLIAQFFKSQEWMGNITGPYVSDEIGLESNRFGIGFVTGRRMNEKGTFAAAVTLFEQNKWDRFSETDVGAEARLSLFIFGVKLGLIENWKKLYWQVGFSY